MKLPIIEFPSEMFTWSDGGRSASCEASDMGDRHLQRLYDDAMDVGFAMKSEKTGRVVKFYMDEIHKNDEQEVTHWTYKACHEDVRLNPEAMFIVVTVFND